MNLIGLIFILLLPVCILAFHCKDEQGKPVDYWIAIKRNNGADYYVYDVTMQEFMPSQFNVNQSSDGAIMQTVGQLYSFTDGDDAIFGIYNDEPPPVGAAEASSSYAHAKGVLQANATSGYWIVNSMPHFPNQRSVGPGPFPDFTYAQTLMCVTFKSSTIDLIAANLIVNHPYVYDKYSTPATQALFPNFYNWISGLKTTTTNVASVVPSLGGKIFYQLQVSGSWGMDLWDDEVAPYFNTALNVETWRSGSGGRMGSICGEPQIKVTDYDVFEVSGIKMSDGVTWTGTQDHAKWAIASSPGLSSSNGFTDVSNSLSPIKGLGIDTRSSVACVGDNNRMCSQEKRGGGAICTYDLSIWLAFNKTINGFEGCYDYNPCTGTSTKCYWCPT